MRRGSNICHRSEVSDDEWLGGGVTTDGVQVVLNAHPGAVWVRNHHCDDA